MKPENAPMEEFLWSEQEEPHKSRRLALLKEHPGVLKRFAKKNWTLIPTVLLANVVQFSLAFALRDSPWWALLIVAYTVGGTVNHAMTLAMHELAHNLASKSLFVNRVVGMLSNLPLGIPSYATFKRYHLEHHKYQGEEGIDVDVPTSAEGVFFITPLRKVLWCFMQPLFYSLRPIIVLPKALSTIEGINWVVQVVVDAAVVYYWGPRSLLYLIGGTLLGMGVHPMAGHFIAEHYTFEGEQETYSYYGPLNWFSYNVGYHNEHHDFPNVPGTDLPKVRQLSATEYDDLPIHSSWIKVIYRYITNPKITPFSRVKRNTMGGGLSPEESM